MHLCEISQSLPILLVSNSFRILLCVTVMTSVWRAPVRWIEDGGGGGQDVGASVAEGIEGTYRCRSQRNRGVPSRGQRDQSAVTTRCFLCLCLGTIQQQHTHSHTRANQGAEELFRGETRVGIKREGNNGCASCMFFVTPLRSHISSGPPTGMSLHKTS